MPDQFFRAEMARQGVALPPFGEYGVGMIFLPQEPASRLAFEEEIARAIRAEGQILLGWRDVPRDNSGLGESVKKIEPVIRQVFIGRGPGVTVTDALERKLYIIRKSAGHAIQALQLAHGQEFYVPSMSARTIAHMLLATRSELHKVICKTRGWSPRSLSCTSGSRPIRSRRGTWHTRSG